MSGFVSVVLFCTAFAQAPNTNPTLSTRIAPPSGFTRTAAAGGSFAAWLRALPLKPGRPDVRLFNGRLKGNQTAHHAVIDIDTGFRDLQQCADAVIRLRAEFLLASGRDAEIAFRFTSGDVARWADWRRGMRPVVTGNRVAWRQSAPADSSRTAFRAYLDTVFTYAGSHSLEKELSPVAAAETIEPGDVFIQGGFPGHAVIVLDTATSSSGRHVFLVGQSFMPAQDMHVLVNTADGGLSPWFADDRRLPLRTPEWNFPVNSLRRFR